MNDEVRAMLEGHLDWLHNEVIPGFERSQQPPSWKAESIRRARQQVANIEWRLATGNPAPLCGWKGLYADHPTDCEYCARHSKRLHAARFGAISDTPMIDDTTNE